MSSGAFGLVVDLLKGYICVLNPVRANVLGRFGDTNLLYFWRIN